MLLLALCLALTAGCQEVETLKREVLKKLDSKLVKKKNPFTPRDGITIRPSSLYRSANPNSEIIRNLPPETPVHMTDKIGEWYRVRTRDGREGYVQHDIIGGEEILRRTLELRRSIEGMPVQAEGVLKNKANFRLQPGRHQHVVDVIPSGKKFEMYERVVTLRDAKPAHTSDTTRGREEPTESRAVREEAEPPGPDDTSGDPVKKDVWYKVKIEDGRVGYLFTHNLSFTPPEDIARIVPYMRLLAWRAINATDDPDLGAVNDYLLAYAPMGKDPRCDYSRLYFVTWSNKLKRRVIIWQLGLTGILPITDYQYEGKPGFSVRYLHPTKQDRLVLASFAYLQGRIKAVSEEEIPDTRDTH